MFILSEGIPPSEPQDWVLSTALSHLQPSRFPVGPLRLPRPRLERWRNSPSMAMNAATSVRDFSRTWRLGTPAPRANQMAASSGWVLRKPCWPQ